MTLPIPTPCLAAPLRKLLTDFGRKMRQIHRLTMKVGQLSQKMEQRPSLWMKLDQWLVQLGSLKQQEQDVLSRIKTIEEQHKKLRLKKQLKMARTPELDAPRPTTSSRRRNRAMWAWLIVIYMMMRMKKRGPLPTLTNG